MSTQPTGSLNRTIYIGVLILIAVAMRWEAVAAIGLLGLFVLWTAERLFFSQNKTLSWVASSVQPMIWVFLGICAVQLLPLPAGLLETLSPQTLADKSEAHSILTGEALIRAAIAYAPARAAVKLAFLVAAACAFFLTLNTLTARSRVTGALSVLVGLGVVEALMVVGRVLAGEIDPAADARAAGILIGALPAALGLYLSLESRSERLEPGLDGTRAGVQRLVGKLAPESFRPAGVLLALSVLATAAALFLCASTVTRFAAGLSLIAGAALFFAGKRNKKGGLFYLVLGLFFVFTLGVGTADNPGASRAARAVSAAAKDYPLLGIGLGSFADLYPRYTEKSSKQKQVREKRKKKRGKAKENTAGAGAVPVGSVTAQQRNSPAAQQPAVQPPGLPAYQLPGGGKAAYGAEISAESGVLAFAVLLFAAGYFVFRIARIRYRRRDRHATAVGTGAGAGFLSLVLVGLTGPYTLAFSHLLAGALLAAAGKAAVFRRGRGFKERFFYKKREVSLPAAARVGVLVAIGAVAAVIAMPLAEHPEASTRKIEKRKEKIKDGEAAPLRSQQRNPSAADPATFNRPPAGVVEQSLLSNPAQPGLWVALGRLYASRRADPFEYLDTWLPRADGCYAQAVSYAPLDPAVLIAAADHFVERAAMHSGGGEGRGEAIVRFQEFYRRALRIEPARWKAAVDRVWTFFPEEHIVLSIVPEKMEDLRDRVLRYIVSR